MKTHELKTWPEYFEAVLDGSKPFEIRENDRGFQVGDTLELWEYNPYLRTPLRYSGRKTARIVTYILDGNQFGLRRGFVAMGLAPLITPSRPTKNQDEN